MFFQDFKISRFSWPSHGHPPANPAHPVTEDVHPQRQAILRDAGVKLHHLEPRSVRRDPVNQGGSMEGMGSITLVNGCQWMLMDVNGC